MKKLLSSLFLVFLGVFLIGSFSVKAEDELIEAIDSASIRIKTEESAQGLKFSAKLAESVLPIDVGEHGFYLVYGKWTVAELEALDAFTSLEVNEKEIFRVVVEGFTAEREFNVVLTGIPEKGYMDALTVIPFAAKNAEVELKVAPVTRSVGQVAIAMGEDAPVGIIDVLNNNYVRVGFVDNKLEVAKGVEGVNVSNYEFYYDPVSITLPEAPFIAEKTFLHYKLEEITYEVGDVFVFTEDVLFELVYDEEVVDSYEVEFLDYDGEVLKTESVNHGQAANAPASPTRVGYTFIGWDVDFTNITSELVVTALYEVNTYSVTYNLDHGIFGYTDRTEMIGDFLTDYRTHLIANGRTSDESLNVFLHGEGNTSGFDGTYSTYNTMLRVMGERRLWNDYVGFSNVIEYYHWTPIIDLLDEFTTLANPEDKGKVWDDNEIIKTVFKPFVMGTTLGAVSLGHEIFSKIPDTLKFQGIDVVNNYTYGTTNQLPIPVRFGYKFVGWYNNASFTDSPITSLTDTDLGNKTLYAKWEDLYVLATRYLTDGAWDTGGTGPITFSTQGGGLWNVMGFKETSVSGVYELVGKGTGYTNSEAELYIGYHNNSTSSYLSTIIDKYNKIQIGDKVEIKKSTRSQVINNTYIYFIFDY